MVVILKTEILKKYVDYIKLIKKFGKGIMLTIHIEEYFQKMQNVEKHKVNDDLRVLESHNLIEFHKLHSNNYVKLKKSAIAYIENKNNHQVASVTITYRKLKRVIMINELILKYDLKTKDIDELFEYFKKNTTLLNKSKENYEILNNFKPNHNVTYEIKKLKQIRENQIRRLNNEEALSKIDKEFSLNNMQARAIYITKITKDKMKVVLLDLNNNYDSRKLLINLKATYNYLRLLTDKKVEFALVLHSSNRKKYFLSRKNKILNKLIKLNLYNQFNLRFVNLDITRKLFSNVKFLI